MAAELVGGAVGVDVGGAVGALVASPSAAGVAGKWTADRIQCLGVVVVNVDVLAWRAGATEITAGAAGTAPVRPGALRAQRPKLPKEAPRGSKKKKKKKNKQNEKNHNTKKKKKKRGRGMSDQGRSRTNGGMHGGPSATLLSTIISTSCLPD